LVVSDEGDLQENNPDKKEFESMNNLNGEGNQLEMSQNPYE
jgi:hypothetical protein